MLRGGGKGVCVPQRRQRVCDLVWRLPKDEVPFADVFVSHRMLSMKCFDAVRWWGPRTHRGLRYLILLR